jgi:hypothetical protein
MKYSLTHYYYILNLGLQDIISDFRGKYMYSKQLDAPKFALQATSPKYVMETTHA